MFQRDLSFFGFVKGLTKLYCWRCLFDKSVERYIIEQQSRARATDVSEARQRMLEPANNKILESVNLVTLEA